MGLNKYYKLKHAKDVPHAWKTTKIFPCFNCGKKLRITGYPQKKYKRFFCDKQCEARGRSYNENHNLLGGYISKDGYKYIRVNGRHALEHRVVMERLLGRKLSSVDHVHHLNGIRHDNRIENLEVVSNKRHPTETLKFIQRLQMRIRELEAQLHV